MTQMFTESSEITKNATYDTITHGGGDVVVILMVVVVMLF